MTEGVITAAEAERFLAVVQGAATLPAGALHQLNVALPESALVASKPGIF